MKIASLFVLFQKLYLFVYSKKKRFQKEYMYLFDKSCRMDDMCPMGANGNMISGVELSQSAAACMLSPIWYTTPC
jgi:hypothetical protein